MPKFVFISDTHGFEDQLTIPKCDFLIHSGDMSFGGELPVLQHLGNWFTKQPAKNIICIAGNHDFYFEKNDGVEFFKQYGVHYLQDSEVTIDGIKFYGYPWVPSFGPWAFMIDKTIVGSQGLKGKAAAIPKDTNVLITHGPPYGILDFIGGRFSRSQDTWFEAEKCGDRYLLEKVWEVNPRVHCFGHIHDAYGTVHNGSTTFVNAGLLLDWQQTLKTPIVMDITI